MKCTVCIINIDINNKIFYLTFFKCHVSTLIFLKATSENFKKIKFKEKP